jgi:hypothetical protein
MTEPPPFPYTPQPRPPVDSAEFAAVRTIVIALVAEMAEQRQSTGVDAQTWINAISVRCQESIVVDTHRNDRQADDRLKARVRERINNILTSIRVAPRDRDTSD